MPIFREYPFSMDEFRGLTCPKRDKMTVLTEAETDKQERNQRTLCGACLRKTEAIAAILIMCQHLHLPLHAR